MEIDTSNSFLRWRESLSYSSLRYGIAVGLSIFNLLGKGGGTYFAVTEGTEKLAGYDVKHEMEIGETTLLLIGLWATSHAVADVISSYNSRTRKIIDTFKNWSRKHQYRKPNKSLSIQQNGFEDAKQQFHDDSKPKYKDPIFIIFAFSILIAMLASGWNIICNGYFNGVQVSQDFGVGVLYNRIVVRAIPALPLIPLPEQSYEDVTNHDVKVANNYFGYLISVSSFIVYCFFNCIVSWEQMCSAAKYCQDRWEKFKIEYDDCLTPTEKNKLLKKTFYAFIKGCIYTVLAGLTPIIVVPLGLLWYAGAMIYYKIHSQPDGAQKALGDFINYQSNSNELNEEKKQPVRAYLKKLATALALGGLVYVVFKGFFSSKPSMMAFPPGTSMNESDATYLAWALQFGNYMMAQFGRIGMMWVEIAYFRDPETEAKKAAKEVELTDAQKVKWASIQWAWRFQLFLGVYCMIGEILTSIKSVDSGLHHSIGIISKEMFLEPDKGAMDFLKLGGLLVVWADLVLVSMLMQFVLTTKSALDSWKASKLGNPLPEHPEDAFRFKINNTADEDQDDYEPISSNDVSDRLQEMEESVSERNNSAFRY